MIRANQVILDNKRIETSYAEKNDSDPSYKLTQ
jgi:hypothetical protein